MSKVVGIDLGTTNSVVAIMEGSEPVVITNSEGGRTTPSVVGFTKDDNRLVGQVAKRQAFTNPENTIYSIKRFMGRRFNEVRDEIRHVPYEVTQASNGYVRVVAGGKEYSPPEISAMILQKLKQAAEDYLGQKVTQAVITVPAYFNAAQRQATKDAGKIAGLDVLFIISEPSAAAMAYGLDKENDETIAIFDFGGGGFNVSILKVGEGVVEVESTNGDTHLGGDDIDERLIRWLIDEFKKDQKSDLSKDKMALQRLKEAAEKAKIELSSTMETEINLPFITADQSGPKHLVMKLTRAKFESLVDDILQRTLKPCEQALKDAGLNASQIDEVVLVGGSTRIPKIQEMVKTFFGKEPHKGVNPDEVVAIGAGVQAGVLSGEVKDMLLMDVIPVSLGIETPGGVFTKLIERNTMIPTRKSEIFSTETDNQTSFEVHVLQGERPMAVDNLSLDKLHLAGIPPAPRGTPQIEVTFDIDANGILNVSARDLGTGREQKISITGSSGLAKEEISRMMRDVESHAEKDRLNREMIETKNRLDSLIYQIEKAILDNREKIPVGSISVAESAIAEAKKIVDANNTDRFQAQIENLIRVSLRIADALYQQSITDIGASNELKRPTATPSPDSDGSSGGNRVGRQNIYDERGVHVAQSTQGQLFLITVFISYAHQDGAQLAGQLEADLRARGFNTWWDDGIPPGHEWETTIREAIDRSNAMVVLFTEAAPQSRYLDAEWHYAHDERKIPVIPVLAPDFDKRKLPLVLRRIQWADLNADYAVALDRLVNALRDSLR